MRQVTYRIVKIIGDFPCQHHYSSLYPTSSIGTTSIDRTCSLRAFSFCCVFSNSTSNSTNSINDSDDPFERMLAVLRFTFTKDLKFIVRMLRTDFPDLTYLILNRWAARQNLQTLQFRLRRTFSLALGRNTSPASCGSEATSRSTIAYRRIGCIHSRCHPD